MDSKAKTITRFPYCYKPPSLFVNWVIGSAFASLILVNISYVLTNEFVWDLW